MAESPPPVEIHLVVDVNEGLDRVEAVVSPAPKLQLPFLQDIKKRRTPDTPRLTPDGKAHPLGRGRLPFISELLASRRRGRPSRDRPSKEASRSGTDVVPSPQIEEIEGLKQHAKDAQLLEAIKSGVLMKTSRSRREGSKSGPSRERRFRLTEEGLEYLQPFSQIKVKRSFPLTSLEKIVYEPETEPLAFDLFFSTYIMKLEADSAEAAMDWVGRITDAWQMWQLPAGFGRPRQLSTENLLEPPPPAIAEEEEPQDDDQESPSAAPKESDVTPVNRPRSHTAGELAELRRESTEIEMTYQLKRKRRVQRIRKAAHIRPKLEKSKHRVASGADMSQRLHDDYAMIKYPRKKWAIPSEKVFRMDKDNLQILWRNRDTSHFKLKNSLSLHRIVEVREGQQTESFEHFPYEEVAEQSFSLVYEAEKKGGKFVRLASLNLICDHPDAFNEWMEGLRTLLPGPQCTSTQYDNTDPTILWLKQLWTCCSIDHELTMNDAMGLTKKITPGIRNDHAKTLIKIAHQHQFRHTFNSGYALRWDGLVLVLNLLCGTSGRLYQVFQEYAKTYPKLGMTREEFREFLINECCWQPRMCTKSELQLLMHHHDFHHRAFKKYVADNKPLDYQIASKLLSYAGFISFLRSKDNSAINLEHNTVYQDMSQPLSHYFINSSHNTYLEADQLYGKSSNDAYIRALLQGSRCIEIDCWDDTLGATGVNEPIIYHGFTLTTKLPFREVIQTIQEYAFRASYYPLIISIENHCCANQQAKMARIFKALMGGSLVTENLVELEGRERLPSPEELQGKIILKGSFKGNKGTAPRTTRERARAATAAGPTSPKRITSQSSQTSNESCIPPSTGSVNAEPQSPIQNGPGGTEEVSSITFAPSAPYTRQSIKEWTRSLEANQSLVLAEDDQELVFQETEEALKRLIIYCRAVSIKPWSWKKQKLTAISEMFSIGEPSALRHTRDSAGEMLACTERQLVRTYPKGVRFDSSNYTPMPMWNCGIQMVALNYQTPDVYMHLNQGLFRLNGGCGYVLKPEVMRRPEPVAGPTPFLPDMSEPHPDVPTVDLEIELISGQRLCPWNKKCTQVTVDIHTYGINHDNSRMQQASHNYPFWPQWQKGMCVFRKRILMPELCLVYFRVEVVLKTLGNAQLYAQNCIPLISLMPGIKFIPLRTPGGELIPESGLFVRVKKTEDKRRVCKKPSLQHQDSMDESLFGDVDVTQAINPALIQRGLHRQEARSTSPRRMSSPPTLDPYCPVVEPTCTVGSHQVDWRQRRTRPANKQVKAEVHPSSSGSPEVSPAHSTIEREKGKVVFSVEASGLQPVSEGGVTTLPFEPEKEFHLEVVVPNDDLELTYI